MRNLDISSYLVSIYPLRACCQVAECGITPISNGPAGGPGREFGGQTVQAAWTALKIGGPRESSPEQPQDVHGSPPSPVAWHPPRWSGRLRSSQSVLIHAGAGGTGQAGIQIAQYLGAKVYTTVSTREKKQFLIDEYKVPADRIFYSRDTSFARDVMKTTHGRGIDVVINILGGEIQQASWDCVAPYGLVIQLGSPSNASLSFAQSGKQTSFTHFDSARWMRDRPEAAKEAVETALSLLADNKLRVQSPCQVEDASSVEEKFRSLQDGVAMGKTVIDLTAMVEVPTVLDTKVQFQLDSNATYIIAGGLGGLGRSIARWMVDRGARHLVLLGRSGAKTKAALELIDELARQGACVHAPPCDVMDAASVKQVMEDVSQTMPPIKGCVQGSMVLRDQMFSEMSHEDWRVSVECKALGSWNLEMNLPRDLDFFVMLSSASNIIGLTGQSNYAAGNSYMDSLARYRVAHGQKAISLDLGPMVDDGILVETAGFLDKVLGYGSLAPVTRAQFYGIFDHYCNPNQPLLTPDTAQLVFGISGSTGDGPRGNTLAEHPLFSRLQLDNITGAAGVPGHDQIDFKRLFQEASSLQEGRDIVRRAVIDKMVHSYRLIPEDAVVDVYAPLHTFRVDSLLAVELCNWIGKEFAADVAVLEVMGGATLAMLDLLVATKSQLSHPQWA
ncbi:MDR/SDR family oxidoreductase [Aspergillus ibericus CBS 121593]|uniref:KR-domain-containing protein n=1 Tax=Aspergillus ibericus CBS 121593 TaxID=1448316 RepID=A0A395GV31_9EURO|nr:KR-domain-containing protein [Aspergillus ibericus CBS 121593]RAK99269.1 KR-domain-containing protein [Aspergillus ibericus CBS 121593]